MDQHIDQTEEVAEAFKVLRLQQLQNTNSYPHKFLTTKTFAQYRQRYDTLETGSRHHEFPESLAGRVQEKRESGNKLVFYTVISDGLTIQYLCDKREYLNPENFKKDNDLIHRGDIIGVTGFAGKSLKGELSIYVLSITLLSPCLKVLPKANFGLKDPDIRARKRYFDLIANPDTRNVFIIRSLVFKELRRYLDDQGFIEVQTPILSLSAGGASAKPFMTYHNDLDQDMALRIAPELFLKQLVVGGLNRVYEIGPQFRNEGIDPSHNPEFSSLEFYMAYADYNDLFTMCEDIFARIVLSIHGTLKIKYQPLNKEERIIDFTPPYRRIDMMSELENRIGITFPKDLSSDETRTMLDDLCTSLKVECGHPRTNARLIDKLVGHFIEPDCQNPTFIMNQPLVMSPLAKQHRHNPQLSERFELFVTGMELANAYTELNDPQVQRERFESQLKAKNQGDDEAQGIDETFIDSLEYGLPPTGGFGLGIERLVMLMTNKNTIRDVITFPSVTDLNKKTVIDPNENK